MVILLQIFRLASNGACNCVVQSYRGSSLSKINNISISLIQKKRRYYKIRTNLQDFSLVTWEGSDLYFGRDTNYPESLRLFRRHKIKLRNKLTYLSLATNMSFRFLSHSLFNISPSYIF